MTALGLSLRPSVASKRVISLKVWIWPQRTNERALLLFYVALGVSFLPGEHSPCLALERAHRAREAAIAHVVSLTIGGGAQKA